MMEFERIADKKRLDFIVASIRNAVPVGGEVLDIGCGNGIITHEIGKHGFEVTGIDVSSKTIAAATAANTLPNVRFLVAQLPAEGSLYDAVVCSEVLEHLHYPEELLSVIARSLKPAGILVVTVPNGRGPRELFVTRPVQSLQTGGGTIWKLLSSFKSALGYTGTTVQSSADDLTHLQFFSLKHLGRLAASTGFDIIKVHSSNFMEQVFPFSLAAKKSAALQRLDCRLADILPLAFTSGFMSVWKKNPAVQTQ